jgi:hypothetical protein
VELDRRLAHDHVREAHAVHEHDAGLLRVDGDRSRGARRGDDRAERGAERGRLAGEVIGQPEAAAGVREVLRDEAMSAVGTAPERADARGGHDDRSASE